MTISIGAVETTTEEIWSVDGVPLNTLAYNISTLGGSRLGVPTLRGGNVTVPYRPGDMWVPKMPASRVITLGMWVQGSDERGVVSENVRGKFTENWLMLKQLFWRTDRQLTLLKRIKRLDGSFIEATALCEFVGGLEPEMSSPGRAAFTVDLMLADPFFYSTSPLVWMVTSGEDEPPSYFHPGHDTQRFMEIQFTGGADYALTNETSGVTLSLPGVSGDADLDTRDFTAFGSGVPILEKVTVTGPPGVPYWFLLAREQNTLRLSGGGSATILFRPVYT